MRDLRNAIGNAIVGLYTQITDIGELYHDFTSHSMTAETVFRYFVQSMATSFPSPHIAPPVSDLSPTVPGLPETASAPSNAA